MKRFTLVIVAICAVGFLTGCYKNPTISPLFPPTAPTRFYVANFNSGKVNGYAQPLKPTSTPALTITIATPPDSIASDAVGNLYVPNNGVIYVYAQPISATSAGTPFTITGGVGFRGLIVNKSGTMWIADAFGNQLMQLTVPFAASPVAPIRTIKCTCAGFTPFAVATDLGGHIFAADASGHVYVFNIPAATGLSTLAPVATLTSPTGSAVGLATDVQNRLFVTEEFANQVMIYNPPFGTGNQPVDFISAPVFTDLAGLEILTMPTLAHIDSSGLLYVTYGSDTTAAPTGGLAVFAPPFNSSSLQLFLIQGVGSGMSFPVDTAFAP